MAVVVVVVVFLFGVEGSIPFVDCLEETIGGGAAPPVVGGAAAMALSDDIWMRWGRCPGEG